MWRSESWDLVGGCWLTGHFALRIILVLLGPISGLLSYYMISFSHMLMMSFTMLWHSQASPLQKNCHYFQNGKLNEPLLLCQSLVFHYKAEDKLIHDPTSHEKNRGCCLSLRDSKNKNVLAPRTLPLSLSLFTFLQKTPSSQWWSFCLKARDVESHILLFWPPQRDFTGNLEHSGDCLYRRNVLICSLGPVAIPPSHNTSYL